jgi:small subunit ribosomal protein S9
MTTETPVRKKLRKPSPKQRERGILVKAKKKTASARAVIKAGKGKVMINRKVLGVFQPRYLKMLIEEPILLAGDDLMNSVNIRVNVQGGGFSGQAVAARGAIAKALVMYTADEKLKERFLEYDRGLLVDDVRRKEAKKPLGRGARQKKQMSKR